MKKYTILISGGIGKHICATTMLRHIQEKEKDARITVISGYPEIFLFNPRVYRNLHHMAAYTFDDYIKGTEIRQGDPYSELDYYTQKKHCSELYSFSYGFGLNENIYPEIYLSEDELREAEDLFKQSKLPMITFQPTGGNQQANNQSKDPRKFSGRDLSQDVAQQVVDSLADKYNIVQVALPHEYKLKGVKQFNLPFRRFIALIPFIKGHIGIDSAMMHAVASFNKPGLILWGNTNKACLGYKNFLNVNRSKCPTPMCGRPHVSLPDLVPEGAWICPYGQVCNKWQFNEIPLKEFQEKMSGPIKIKL